MRDVTRYVEAGSDKARWMQAHPEGDWVEFSDYLALAKLASVNSHEALVKALAKIAEHMNADNEQSYRADDPEGAMDTVYELAVAALRLAKGGQ